MSSMTKELLNLFVESVEDNGSVSNDDSLLETTDRSGALREFPSVGEWISTLMVLGVIAANPKLSQDEAIAMAQIYARKIAYSKSVLMLQRTFSRMNEVGLMPVIAQVGREFSYMLGRKMRGGHGI